jgi:hypothetical protein
MVPAQSHHDIEDNIQEALNGSPLAHDDFTDDDGSDDIVSLLEENARLRKIVVRLSEIVLRNVADEK